MPKDIILLPSPMRFCIIRHSSTMGRIRMSVGKIQVNRKFIRVLFSCGATAEKVTPLSDRRFCRSASGNTPVE